MRYKKILGLQKKR